MIVDDVCLYAQDIKRPETTDLGCPPVSALATFGRLFWRPGIPFNYPGSLSGTKEDIQGHQGYPERHLGLQSSDFGCLVGLSWDTLWGQL